MAKTFESSSSFTADSLVICRCFTNLPLTREIADVFNINCDSEYLKEHPLAKFAIRRTPLFEARYILTDKLLWADLTQIVELAAGMSPRGMDFTRDGRINYVEVDLPEKSEMKKNLVDKLTLNGVISTRSNLHFAQGNVAEKKVFNQIDSLLRPGPIAVVNEGLLRYMSFRDKARLAKNILRLLQKNGGAWITPDIELSDYELATEAQQRKYQEFAKRTGLDVRQNLFRNEQHAISFFEKLGFHVKHFSLLEVMDQLVSPDRLNISSEEVVSMLKHRMTFMMTVA